MSDKPFSLVISKGWQVNKNLSAIALEARAIANGFLTDNLPDRFVSAAPNLDETEGVWRLKVLLSYPIIGSVGQVGELTVDVFSSEVVAHTPFDEMRARALKLYEQHREAIETPIP